MKEYLKKIDLKFIMIVSIMIIVSFVLSIFFNGESSYINSDLPLEYEKNFSKLIINEVVTKNEGVYVNEENVVCDYIELYNGTSSDINLFGYGLSDNSEKIKYYFPEVIIKSNDYLVVSLTGDTNLPLNAPFKLSSSKSESIVLTNPNFKVIDGVDTLNIEDGKCLSRDENGNWFVCDYCTPGFENSYEGLNAYYASLQDDNNDELIINEFLARNKGNYINEDKSDKGFIEFKNISNHSINLSDYCISDDYYLPFKKQLPDINLAGNEIYAINLGNGSYIDNNYLGFNFEAKNGQIVLSKNGKIISNIEYHDLPNGNSYKYNDGQYFYSMDISFNQENNDNGVDKFQAKYLVNKTGLIINEVMNNNHEYLPNNGNSYYGFIELYNNSNDDILLNDYYLSDSDSNIKQYQLPSITLKANEYIVFLCSGDEVLTNTYYHTNFKMSDNTGVYLSNEDGLVDCVHICDLPLGYSYGRSDKYGFYYFEKPTPLQKNSEGIRTRSSIPNVSLKGGVYNDVDSLSITISSDENVYYTLDGSEPTIYSHKYNEPIVIKKTCVLKVRSIDDNSLGSKVITNSYIINENHSLPIISVSLDGNDFNSINANYSVRDYVKNAYVEFFDGEDGFASNCGLSLYGDESRIYAKKNYSFRFDKEYGASNLHYKVFENRENCNYDVLSIRAGGQDWNKGIINDSLGTSLIEDYTDVLTYANRSVVAYINGQYWGVYSLREKKSKSFFEDNLNISSDYLNLHLANGDTEYGSSDGYNELVEYCNNHDLSNDECYQYVVDRIDINEWVDFWIGQMYVANIDFFNIRYFSSPELDDNKWKIVFYDLDFAFETPGYNSYTNALTLFDGFHCHWANQDGPQDRIENVIIRNLFKNDSFRNLWLERLNYNLNNTWKTSRVLERLDKYVAEFEPEMARDRGTWGLTKQDWLSYIDSIRYFIENRQKYVLSTTKSFFNLTDDKMKEIFGDLYA